MGDLIKAVDSEVSVPEEASDRLIWLAIQHGADVEKLEKLIALKNAEEARMAKKLYDERFAQMQADFTPAERTKTGDRYKYAPIEELQKHYGPIISKHGFSYRWNEQQVEGGKRCTLRISGWGHAEENSFDIPMLEGTKLMNSVQVAGAMSTYGRRYTFIAGFGIIIEDEDDDALSIPADEAMQYFEQVKLIRESKTLDELKANFKLVWAKLAQGDTAGRAILTKEKDAMKEALSGTKNA